MANQEQLAILKQGVDVWNRWREENFDTQVDFRNIDLRGRVLSHINLSKVNLAGSNLSGAKLYKAIFSEAKMENTNLNEAYLHEAVLVNANLSHAKIIEADLRDADLSEAKLVFANLSHSNLIFSQFNNANLQYADLYHASLYWTNLSNASLFGTNFRETILSHANLDNTDFTDSFFGGTTMISINLSSTTGLENVFHLNPSYIDLDTLKKSLGRIPISFLHGCGLSDLDIKYAKLASPDLSAQEISEITHRIFELKDTRPIQISPLFISYSHANSDFVDKFETKLNASGIRSWRDVHKATAGRLETQIDRAIRHNPTVLLILSEHSTFSDWVEHEARLARKLEKELGRDVLCPITLDDSWKTCNWPERIKEQIMEYNILDFSNWENDDELDAMFKRLIDGLDMFYKK